MSSPPLSLPSTPWAPVLYMSLKDIFNNYRNLKRKNAKKTIKAFVCFQAGGMRSHVTSSSPGPGSPVSCHSLPLVGIARGLPAQLPWVLPELGSEGTLSWVHLCQVDARQEVSDRRGCRPERQRPRLLVVLGQLLVSEADLRARCCGARCGSAWCQMHHRGGEDLS